MDSARTAGYSHIKKQNCTPIICHVQKQNQQNKSQKKMNRKME